VFAEEELILKIVKKLIALSVVVVSTLGMFTSATLSSQSPEIRLIIEGEEVEFDGQRPVIISDRVLVPANSLGGILEPEAMDYLFTRMSGEHVGFDVPAQTVNEVPMMPIRAFAEWAGMYIVWNEDIRTVFIKEGPFRVHIVSEGQTLYSIAVLHYGFGGGGVIEKIMHANNMNTTSMFIGSMLIIPLDTD